jgi:hypothetical protein
MNEFKFAVVDQSDDNNFVTTVDASVVIKNAATGAPTAMVVKLAGPEQPERKRRLFARQRRLRAAMVKTGKLPTSDPEDDEIQAVDELVACTLGWENPYSWCGQFSPEAARKIYSNPERSWFRQQVQEAIDDLALFTRSSVAA